MLSAFTFFYHTLYAHSFLSLSFGFTDLNYTLLANGILRLIGSAQAPMIRLLLFLVNSVGWTTEPCIGKLLSDNKDDWWIYGWGALNISCAMRPLHWEVTGHWMNWSKFATPLGMSFRLQYIYTGGCSDLTPE